MSSYTLKLIALIIMVIDHIGHFFPYIDGMVYMRIIGRLAMPVFFYMLVEGYVHTKDLEQYKMRLLLFSIIMFSGNLLILSLIEFLDIDIYLGYTMSPLSPNIFLSMFLGLNIIENLEKIVKKDYDFKNIIKLFLAMFLSIFTEASYYGILMCIVFFVFRDDKVKKSILYVVGSLIICFLYQNYIQIFMVFAIFLILLYNGQKGKKAMKYFFYVFYMAHIWIFSLLSIFIANYRY